MSTNGQTLSPSYVNSFRISAVTSRLLAHLRGEGNTNKSEFCNLCLSLARGIDYAVSNNDIPGRAPDLPYLLKQLCQRKNDLPSQAAVMVLMISVKSACSNGWFSEKIKEELYVLSDEMQRNFCSVSVDELNSHVKDESNFQLTISTIMSRFYPGMKMGEMFSLVQTKPGYDSYVTDLHISKRSKTSPDDKIYLFVAQTDNIETSSCLISPQQVNFLLNGEGVYKRTCVYKDPGPQMPTPVTHMLKYGSNLLQVVGQFNGRYIVVIAFMSMVSNSSFSTIPDYVQPVAAQPDSDNEIIEGPSRISLKCPISFGRIKTPIKGHSCKHLQCFDFNNYVELNSKRPNWRCPHCSQSVCFHDLRIDQSMAKILKEVEEDVSYVNISGDGSWEAVTENISNEVAEKPNDAQPLNQETTTQNADDVMDLTGNDNEIDKFDEVDDEKPLPAGVSGVTNKKTAPHMEDGFWSEFYSSVPGTRTSDTRLDVGNVIQRNRSLFNSLIHGQSQSQSHTSFPSNTQDATQTLPAQHSPSTVDVDRRHNFSRSHLNQHTSSQSQGLVSSQSPAFVQLGAGSALPQQTSGNRHTSPLSTDRFSSHQQQSPSQRSHLPVQSSGQPAPHIRLIGVGSMTGLASSHSPRFSSPALQPPIQTSVSSSVPVAATGAHRDSGSSVDGSAEETWRPTGRMRGSLSGQQFAEALKHKFIIQPSEPVQPARPPPALNTPRPFIPPYLLAQMANSNNNSRPQPGGSGSGSVSSTAGDAAAGSQVQ